MTFEIKREAVNYGNLDSYFFPRLLMYVVDNENAIAESNSSKIHPVAAFCLGFSEEYPSKEELKEMLFDDDSDIETLHSSIDALLMLKSDSAVHMLGKKVRCLGSPHDIYELQESFSDWNSYQQSLATFVRKSNLKKRRDATILSYIQKVLTSQTVPEEFNAFTDFCRSNLDWDALIFIKLFKLDSEDRTEDFEIIRDNVLNRLAVNNPELAEIIRNGPQQKSDVLILKLLKNPIEKVGEELIQLVVEKIDKTLDREDDSALEERAPLISQLFHIIVRSTISTDIHFTKLLHSTIPIAVRKLMFSGLERSVFKNSTLLFRQVVQICARTVAPNKPLLTTFGQLDASGLYNHLNDKWRRYAMINVLRNFEIAIIENVFGVENKILFGEDDKVLRIFKIAVQFSIWVVTFYKRENEENARKKLYFLDEVVAKLICHHLNEEGLSDESRDHVSRITNSLSALESKDETRFTENKDIVSPTSECTVPIEAGIYSKQDLKDVLNDRKTVDLYKTAVSEELQNTRSNDIKWDFNHKDLGKGACIEVVTKHFEQNLAEDGVEEIDASSKVILNENEVLTSEEMVEENKNSENPRLPESESVSLKGNSINERTLNDGFEENHGNFESIRFREPQEPTMENLKFHDENAFGDDHSVNSVNDDYTKKIPRFTKTSNYKTGGFTNSNFGSFCKGFGANAQSENQGSGDWTRTNGRGGYGQNRGNRGRGRPF